MSTNGLLRMSVFNLPRIESGEALAAPLGGDVVWNPELVEIFATVSDEIEPGDINLSKLSNEEVLKLL